MAYPWWTLHVLSMLRCSDLREPTRRRAVHLPILLPGRKFSRSHVGNMRLESIPRDKHYAACMRARSGLASRNFCFQKFSTRISSRFSRLGNRRTCVPIGACVASLSPHGLCTRIPGSSPIFKIHCAPFWPTERQKVHGFLSIAFELRNSAT